MNINEGWFLPQREAKHMKRYQCIIVRNLAKYIFQIMLTRIINMHHLCPRSNQLVRESSFLQGLVEIHPVVQTKFCTHFASFKFTSIFSSY